MSRIKSILTILSLVILLVSNVASIVSAGFHDLLHGALRTVLSVGGDDFAERTLRHSPMARMEENKKVAKAMGKRIGKRLSVGVARNAASLPAESIPILGIATAVAMTAWDVKDACDTMRDFNDLLVRLGEGEEETDVCGQKLPTKEELVARACAMMPISRLCTKASASL